MRHLIRRMVFTGASALVILGESAVVQAQPTSFPIAGYQGGTSGGERVDALGIEGEKGNLRFCQVVAVSKTKPNAQGFVEFSSEVGQGTDYVSKWEDNKGLFAGKSYCAYPTGTSWPQGKNQLHELTPSNAAGCAPINTTTGCVDVSFRISQQNKGSAHVQCISFVVSDGTKGLFWGGNGHNSKCYTSERKPATCILVDPVGGRLWTLDQLPPEQAEGICRDFAKLK